MRLTASLLSLLLLACQACAAALTVSDPVWLAQTQPAAAGDAPGGDPVRLWTNLPTVSGLTLSQPTAGTLVVTGTATADNAWFFGVDVAALNGATIGGIAATYELSGTPVWYVMGGATPTAEWDSEATLFKTFNSSPVSDVFDTDANWHTSTTSDTVNLYVEVSKNNGTTVTFTFTLTLYPP